MNFASVLAHHICLALPVAFTQPGAHVLADPCSWQAGRRVAAHSSPTSESGERGSKIYVSGFAATLNSPAGETAVAALLPRFSMHARPLGGGHVTAAAISSILRLMNERGRQRERQ